MQITGRKCQHTVHGCLTSVPQQPFCRFLLGVVVFVHIPHRRILAAQHPFRGSFFPLRRYSLWFPVSTSQAWPSHLAIMICPLSESLRSLLSFLLHSALQIWVSNVSLLFNLPQTWLVPFTYYYFVPIWKVFSSVLSVFFNLLNHFRWANF